MSRAKGEQAPGPLGGFVLGAAYGAIVGATVGVWEALVLAFAGLRIPDLALLQNILLSYAIFGVILGAIAGLARLSGARWAAFVGLGGLSWLVMGALAIELGRIGSIPEIALLLGMPLCLLLAAVATRLIPSEALLAGLAGSLAAVVAMGAPLNMHLVSRPWAGAGAVVNIALLLVATSVGSAVALIAGQGRGARIPALALVALVVGGGLLWPRVEGSGFEWPMATSSAQPPVVLIAIGGARADHVLGGGSATKAMPRLARYARRGWIYTDASSAAPWTLPAVASLLTGRIPSRHGAGVNDGTGSLNTGLPADVPSIPDRLALAGYATAAVVAAPELSSAYGLSNAFGEYDDEAGPAAMPGVVMPLWAVGFELFGWYRIRDAEQLTDRALSFVLAQEDRSWFLFVHYADALGPYLTAIDREVAGLPPRPGRAEAYPAALDKIDVHVDRLISALPRGAMVIIVGDHGVQLNEARHSVGSAATGPWYGHTMYQELLHVPLIFVGPGVGRGRSERPVSTLDILPTLDRMLGLPGEFRGEGEALVEITGGEPSSQRILLAEGIRYGPENQAARKGSYKLIRRAGGKVSLYDLSEDPTESRPLIWSEADHQMIQKTLQAAMPHIGAARMGQRPPTIGQELGELVDRLGANP